MDNNEDRTLLYDLQSLVAATERELERQKVIKNDALSAGREFAAAKERSDNQYRQASSQCDHLTWVIRNANVRIMEVRKALGLVNG